MGKKYKRYDVVEVTPDVVEPASTQEEPKVDFDGWYAARKGRIPAQHHKEILKADFKARKVPAMSTMETWDAALAKYGVKLAD